MKSRLVSLFASAACALAVLVSSPLDLRGQAPEQVVILLNARNPTKSLPKAQVRNMFMGTTSFWHGVVPVKVFIRSAASPAAKLFFEPILGKSAQAYAKHWDRLQLAGRGVAPKKVGSAAEMAGLIAKVPGGIGFALSSEAWQTPGVKAVPVK